MKKKCTICKDEKELEFFSLNKTKKDGYNNICKLCSSKRSKKYYIDNREQHILVITERKNRVILENRIKIFDYFKLNPCIDCDNPNPIVLEFDHRDGVNKIACVGELVNKGCSWNTIKKEIDKCDVRCANCHRIRTSIQQGWYKNLNI